MKLLLTSDGLVSDTLIAELEHYADKSISDLMVRFVPTVVNYRIGRQGVVFRQAECFYVRPNGTKMIDIADISAFGVDWREHLSVVDVVHVGGGDTYYLLDQFRRAGFGKWLSDQDDSKIYVGVSTGGIVAGRTIATASSGSVVQLDSLEALGMIDGGIQPHCNQDSFEQMQVYASRYQEKVSAHDDGGAVVPVKGYTRGSLQKI